MKNINRLLAAAAILLSAAACHTNEIDPVKPDPVNPGESGLTITANIVKTRVTYNDRDEGYLDQYWETGDVLFGYYGEDVGNKVILTVSDFDGSGNAILTPVNDEVVATLEELAELDSEVPVDLVYTGANVTAEDYPFDGDGKLVIDMRLQDGANIPACMHARAYVQGGKNKKTLFFKFVNDCAIIEICSLTGLKEEDIDGGALTSLSVSNLVLEGNYSLGADGFILAAKTEIPLHHEEPETVLSDYEKDFGANDGWKVSANAEIMKDGSTVSRYMIAVVPNAEPQEIEVSATVEGVQDSFSHYYGFHAFSAGRCYVISEADVVAKTVDGKYFSTVKEAFNYASGIRSSYPNNNIVTLIKDGIYGLVEHAGPIDSNEGKIVIDYTVTLDLNGCWLNLGSINEEEEYDDFSVSEFFDVTTNGTFTITDLSGCEEAGCISADGNSAASIITNEGTVIIENGMIEQWGSDDVEEPIIIDNSGSLTVERGSLFSCGSVIDSEAGSETYIGVENDTNIDQVDHFDYKLSIYSNGISISIHSDDTDDTIFEMKGGAVSGDEVAVKLDGNNVNGTNVNGKIVYGYISGGNIIGGFKCSTALLVNFAKCTISGGVIAGNNSMNTDRTEKTYGLKLVDAECIIEGGIIDGKEYSYSVYSENSKCTISDGTIKSTSYTNGDPYSDYAGIPTIYCSTTESPQEEEYLFDMSGGSVEGNGLKLFLDNNVTGSITGGNIQTTANHAIQLSGAKLNIDGRYNTIDISNEGINKSTILIGNGSNCTIFGEKATISNSTNGYAVEIKDSECTLSGGKFVNNSANYPAVYCYRSEDSSEGRTTPDLTIQWAKGSRESDSPREGPLIVCTYVPGQSDDPSYLGAVSTKDLLYQESEEAEPETSTNYAMVEISGGYLYANDGAFYSQSQEGSLSITGSFYTNLGSAIKSPYFDFTQECLKYVSSESVDVVEYGDYNFDHKITSVSEEPSTDPDPIKSRFL